MSKKSYVPSIREKSLRVKKVYSYGKLTSIDFHAQAPYLNYSFSNKLLVLIKTLINHRKKDINTLFNAGAYRIEEIYVYGKLSIIKVHTENIELDNAVLLKLFPESTILFKSQDVLDGPGGSEPHKFIFYEYTVQL